jgi:hypothetical protein
MYNICKLIIGYIENTKNDNVIRLGLPTKHTKITSDSKGAFFMEHPTYIFFKL